MGKRPRLAIKGDRMYIVSGCPRSGTSMMMKIMEHVYGADRILGKKWPKKKERKVKRNEIQEYIHNKLTAQNNRAMLRARDMNPNGYYEMDFSVRGILYSPRHEKLLNEILEDEKPRICKIVSQGLAASDPKYIDKIIYMSRDPRAVAKSQERLGRNSPMDPESAPTSNGKKVLIRDIAMFVSVTTRAAKWIINHSDIPVIVMNYNCLLDDPVNELLRLQEFMGEGDFSSANQFIDTSLRRSAPEDIEGEEASYAMGLYEALNNSDFGAIRQAHLDKIKEPSRINTWFCTRTGRRMEANECHLCKTHIHTALNFISTATRKGICWETEPCAYECGVDGSEGIDIASSITNNHWVRLMNMNGDM